MRACRTELPRRAAATALALSAAVLAGAGSAAAQIGSPIPLLPPAATGSGQASPLASSPETGPGITAAPLAPTDASWEGVLSQNQGAFPQTMWQGTSRAFVAAALPLLQPSTSPVLQELARRLLLSNATAPAGQDASDRPPLAKVRLDRLLALGDVDGAVAMMDSLPPDPSGDGLDRTRVELHFAANDTSGACAAVESLIARYQNPWWQRALIACQALAGDGAKAALGQSLLREQKAKPDPVFDALIDALEGRPRRIAKLPDPTPLRLALLAAAKLPLPKEALEKAGPGALLGYATSTAPSVERRLPAAERAALLGAMAPERLAALYEQVNATPDQETAALKDRTLPDDPRSRAVLFDIAHSSAPDATRAAAIAAFLAAARKRHEFPFAARLLAPAIDELTPSSVSTDFAGDAARALLIAGKSDAAARWITAANSKTLTLIATLAIPPSGEQDPRTMLHEAIAEIAGHNGGAAQAQSDLLLALFAAFDTPIGDADWGILLGPPHAATLPNAGLWVEQQRASAAKRIGATVLTSAVLLQSGEQLSLEPVLLGRVISGLRAIGYQADARALALEAAIDAGL